jgi:hypothetical protein
MGRIRGIPRTAGAVTAMLLLVAAARSLPAQTLPQGLAGRYNLVDIEGHALPYAPVEPGRPADAPALEVLASTLVVQADGHFVMSMAYRVRRGTDDHVFTNPFSGTFVSDTSGYVMRWDGAGLTPARWEPDRLTFENEGQSYAYRRQGPARPSGS